MRYRLIAICLITGSGLAMFSGVYSAINSLFSTRDVAYHNANMASLEIRYIPEDEINLPSFQNVKGLLEHEYRLIMPSQLKLNNGSELAATMIALDEQHDVNINKLKIIDGAPFDPSKPNEVIIEHNLAKYHHYKVGDKLHLTIGKDSYNLTIRGIAISPEYLIAVANPNYFFPSKGSMAVIFSSIKLLEDRLGFRLTNSLVFKFANDIDRKDLINTLTKIANQKLSIENVIPLNEQPGYLFLNLDLNAFAIFVPAVILIFTLTAMIVTLFLIFQWISAKRQHFGLFMAIGYDKKRLLISSFFPEAILIFGSTIAGVLLSFLTLYMFGNSYANAISLPSPNLILEPGLVVKGILGVIVALSFAMIAPQLKLLSLTPQDAVRGDRSRKQPELGNISRIIAKYIQGRIWLKYAIRNILRAKAVTFITVFSVSMALSVSLSYFISITSFETSILNSFSSDEWNLEVDFDNPVWDDELGIFRKIDGVTQVDSFLRGSIQLIGNGDRKNSIVTGIHPSNTLRRVHIVQGRFIENNKSDEIVLQQKLANDLGLRIGDTVNIESRGHRFKCKLVGIFSGSIPGESLASITSVRNWLDLEDQNTGLFIRAKQSTSDIENVLYKMDHVTRVTQKKNLLKEVTDIVEEALIIIYVAAAFSIAVAVLFVFTSASFSILNRSSEYTMLRILGFGDNIVILTIVTETFLIGFIGALLAIPMGYIISTYLNSYLSEAWFTVNTVIHMYDVFIILLPACLIIPIASFPAIKIILNTQLWKTLRERAFG